MSTIHVTHCSREKDPALQRSGEQVIPERLYTSEGLQRFVGYCRANGFPWAIFSDLYGVVFPEEKICWYSKPPAEVGEEEFTKLLDNFMTRLAAYDEIFFYHRETETHPLFMRIVALGREKGMNITELTEEIIKRD